ncbi:MAG: HAD-IA family hydrolase [Candidatus Thorarchaeota archaeon]
MEKIESIDTIIFDLGGVYFTKGTMLALEKFNDIYNISYKDLFQFFGDIQGSEGYLIRLGLITMDDFEERFFSKFKIEENNKKIIRYIWFGSYVPHYGMKEIIQQLKAEGYNLVIFSGNIRERVEFLDQRYNFLKYFDKAVFSYDLKKNKSNPAFYKELANQVGCKPQESIFIDDEHKNIEMAKTFGFNCLPFYYPEQLLEYLNKFGIDISLK